MTSTRTGARLPQSNLTGLGAVGGPQGVAAGSLRVILEFLTQYDPSAVKQMEADLAQLNSDLANFNQQAAARAASNERLQKRISTAEQKIADADATQRTRRFKRELADIRTLAKDPATRGEAQRRLDQLVNDVRAVTNLTARQEADMRRLLMLDGKRLRGKAAQAALEAQIAAILGQQEVKEQNLSRMQQLRQGVGGKLGALAIGAVGATIGGTILAGTVFMAMQTAVEAVGTAIQENIIDPGKRAREAMEELGGAINGIGEATDADFVKVNSWLQQFGLTVDDTTKAALEQAAAYTRVQASLEALQQATTAASNPEVVRKKQIEDISIALIKAAEQSDNLVTTTQIMGGTAGPIYQEVADKAYYLAEAEKVFVQWSNASAEAAQREAFSKQALAEANNRAAFAQNYLNSQIQASIGRVGESYDARIGAVSTESARTRRLQAAVNRAQSGGGGGGGNASQLANIAEERALTLLRMRLRLLGTSINISKYEGKFRLEAINAKIRALQKEGEAQDRVNKLLDLQYRMSQEIKRNEGESIQAFLERRAQENRDMLTEADDLRRERQIAALNEQKEQLEDEIKLRELAEQAKQAAMQGTQNAYLDGLQKQLEASKKRDEKEAAARKKALEKEKKDLVDAANTGIEIATAEQTATWKTTIRGLDNVQALNKWSGYIAGAYRGKAAIEALVKGFGLPAWVAAPFLAQLNAQIAAWNAQRAKAMANVLPGSATKIHLAEGGVILKNSSTPFGSNVQFGEQGSELGVVLSTRVTDQLRRMNFPQQIGPFMIQSGGDPLRDQFAFKRLVKEAVAEVLR